MRGTGCWFLDGCLVFIVIMLLSALTDWPACIFVWVLFAVLMVWGGTDTNKCPVCGEDCSESDERCPVCGTRLR